MKNLVNELFVNSGRPKQGDNRSYYVKCLNKILSDGLIRVQIAENGKVWTNPKFVDKNGNLQKFNVELKGYGYTGRYYYDRYVDAECVLKSVAKFVSNPSISQLHTKSISIYGKEICECSKCNGRGIIPAFRHYCKGICFDCYGTKYVVKNYSISI